jgi:undecaprenyl-diphosphatase
MQWWQGVILGLVEGVTEYLPISSTGHLILTAWLLGLHRDPAQWQAAFTFNIIIQAGAIVAVLGLYRQRIQQMLRGMLGRDRSGQRLLGQLLVAFLPAAILGPLLDEVIESFLNGPWPVTVALFVGGCLMLVVGYTPRLRGRHGQTIDNMSWLQALLVGCGQCLAMWPGMSRSMVTIVTALLLGMRATAAAEFSFLLGLLTLGAATAYKAMRDGGTMLQHVAPGPLLLGFAAATISAALAVSWFVGFLNRHGVAPFGWYRLLLALACAVLLWFQVLALPASL